MECGLFLRINKELEIHKGGGVLSITNSNHKWHFCCDTDGTTITLCAFSEFDVLVDKIRGLEIDGINISRIFNGHLGDLDVLDIL